MISLSLSLFAWVGCQTSATTALTAEGKPDQHILLSTKQKTGEANQTIQQDGPDEFLAERAYAEKYR